MDLRLRQVRFVEPLRAFEKKSKDSASMHLQHSLGWRSGTPMPIAPFLRHDVMVVTTSADSRGKKDESNNIETGNAANPATATAATTTTIFDLWEPWAGCCTLRYVERTKAGMAGPPTDALQREAHSSGECAARDQLAADFAVHPGDVAWITSGSGAVRCDNLSGECIVHDFHFLLATAAATPSVVIGRNSLIPDDEYFPSLALSSSSENETQQAGAEQQEVATEAAKTAAESTKSSAANNDNKSINQHNNADENGYLRIIAGSGLCATPDVPLLAGCAIPSSSIEASSGISLFAVEAIVYPGGTVRVPLAAIDRSNTSKKQQQQQHRSCIAVIIRGSVRVTNGNIDPVGIRCCRGDAVCLGPVGDAVELRCAPECDCPNGATVLILSAASTTNDKDVAAASIVSPHTHAHVFARSDAELQECLRRYDDGILSKQPATIETIRPLEVKNKNRQRRLLLLTPEEGQTAEDEEQLQEADPFVSGAGTRGLCALSNDQGGPILVAASNDGLLLLRVQLGKTGSVALPPIPLRNKSVDCITSVTILSRRVVVGFSVARSSILLVNNPGAASIDDTMASWYSAAPLFARLRALLIQTTTKKSSTTTTTTTTTTSISNSSILNFNIVGAAEIHGTDIAIYCTLTATPADGDQQQQPIVYVALLKSAELWKYLMTQQDEDDQDAAVTQAQRENGAEEISSRFFGANSSSLTLQPLQLVALEQTGARAVINTVCAPLADTGASRSDTFCAVQLKPLPENEVIRSTQTLLQSLSGAPREVHRRPATGCGIFVVAATRTAAAAASIAPTATATTALQLAEFLPLAELKHEGAHGQYCSVTEVPRIVAVRAVAQIDAERFAVLYSVAPENESKQEQQSQNNRSSNNIKKQQQQQSRHKWTDEHRFGIARLVSERNHAVIPNESDVKLSDETSALRVRVNDGFRPK